VREKCFAKCITKPGPSLSSGEATCVSRCTDRYVDATRMISGVVLQAYSSGQGGVQ
jgi:mitochondrial import inner membrane translocase subunit TIM13